MSYSIEDRGAARKDAYNWPSNVTKRTDPLGGGTGAKVRGQVRRRTTSGGISTVSASYTGTTQYAVVQRQTFKKLPFIGVVGGSGGGYSSASNSSGWVAYQLWCIDGQAPNTTTGLNCWVRRGGKWQPTSGEEWFVKYGDMPGAYRYELQRIGRTYRNAGEQAKYRNELMQTLGEWSYVVLPYLDNLQKEGKFNWASDWFTPGTQFEPTGIGVVDDAIRNFLQWGPVAQLPTGTGGGSGGGSGGSGNDDTSNQRPTSPDPVVRIVTRMPVGYAGTATGRSNRPSMVQRYRDEGSNEPQTDEFTFRYVPQGIKYSGLSGQWIEVPRAEDIPFVDWANWQLMKVSFSFIVADDRTEAGGAIVPDGLTTSVDAQLEKLRRMAQRKVPVVLSNFDDMLTFQLRRASAVNRNASPNMEFVITDLSISATRRTTNDISGSPTTPSAISVAQVDITLTEIPVETVGIVALPPIDTPFIPPPTKKKDDDPNSQGYIGHTVIIADKDVASNIYAQEKAEQLASS